MLTYDTIAKEISSKQLRSAYFLSGEEPYFIEKLVELFIAFIPQDERDFNLSVLYGSDKRIDLSLIVSEAMRFPMMGDKSMVIIKEAQQITDLDKLASLIPEVPHSTCLILAHNKKADKRKALYKVFEKLGAVYESMPIAEREVPQFISSALRAKGLELDAYTAQLMAEHTGRDLEKIMGEVEKLSIVLQGKSSKVTPELIEEHIGISREYNNFELLRAIISRDASKAYRIAYYFAANEKNYPIQMTLPILFNYFSLLMGLFYLSQKDERSIAQALGISPYMAKDYLLGSKHYNAAQTFAIIRQIRLSDAYSKGVDSYLSGGDILKELIAFIFNT